MCLPTLMTWGLAVRKSMIQAHRGVFRLSSIRLPASLLGTMVLKAEIVNKQYAHIPHPSLTVKMREGAVYYLGDSIVCASVWPVGEQGHRDNSGPLEAGWDHRLSQGENGYCGEHWRSSILVRTCSFSGVHPQVMLGHRESVAPSNGIHFSYGPTSGVVAHLGLRIE